MKLKMTQSKKGHTYVQWLTAILANMALVTYGLQSGWVSPMTKVLQSELSPTGSPLSDSEISWVASTLCLSAVVAVPLYAFISDTYGRKAGLVATVVPQALCWLIKLSSTNTAVLITARALAGLAAGGCFNVVPIYVKEISQDDIRGLLGCLLILFQNLGLLVIFVLGAYLDYFTVLWIVVWIPVVVVVLLWKAPESPAFLIKMEKVEEAAEVVAYLRGLDACDKSVQNEINTMRNEELNSKSQNNLSYYAMFKEKAWRKGFTIIMIIMTLAASNGSLCITTFAPGILTTSEAESVSPELQSVIFPAVMLAASLVTMTFVERVGRKALLSSTFIMVSASMIALGTIILTQHQGHSVSMWWALLAMVGVVMGYSAGVCCVPYIMMSEMFNFQIRAKFMGIIVSYAWFVSFFQLYCYGPLVNAFGLHAPFYCFACLNLLGGVATLILLPETRGKSVEQIEQELRK